MTCPTCHHILTNVNIKSRKTEESIEITEYACYSCGARTKVTVEIVSKSALTPEQIEKVKNKPN